MQRFSQACENNKKPILEQLKRYFDGSNGVLEIGSGTGQHAVFFASYLTHLNWYTSDIVVNHESINAWIDDRPSPNLYRPVELMIGDSDWPDIEVDGTFSANTAHIMQKHEVRIMMQLIGEKLPPGGVFCQYGPFIVNGQFTSESNALFHEKLIAEGYGGYRHISELQEWAEPYNLTLREQISMPANNLMLVWKKQ